MGSDGTEDRPTNAEGKTTDADGLHTRGARARRTSVASFETARPKLPDVKRPDLDERPFTAERALPNRT
jgi:hypothetical protein